MPLIDDARTALRILSNLAGERRGRIAVNAQRRQHPRPKPLSIEIAVYFADPPVNLYQIRQWYAPLAKLAQTWPVAIIARSPGAVLALWQEAPVRALYLRQVSDLERFLDEQDLKIIFYVNQNSKNFQMFRYGRVWHVFINHGESDKIYMTTNQFKAYDYSFVAGDAAIERLTHRLWDFDFDRRIIKIGRPQADHFMGALPYIPDDRVTVLYAPTWEGDRDTAAYGSIATHGVALTAALLATGRHRLVYRPHPRSGLSDRRYRAANEAIIAAIAQANIADPAAQHIYDTSVEVGWQLSAPDVSITDISAMIYDRLATGKPVIVTRPKSPDAEIDESGYLGSCEWLSAADAPGIVAIAERLQFDQDAQKNLKLWAERHFGDTTPGVATTRFHAAIEQLVVEWHRHDAIHTLDERRPDGDQLDDEDDDDDYESS